MIQDLNIKRIRKLSHKSSVIPISVACFYFLSKNLQKKEHFADTEVDKKKKKKKKKERKKRSIHLFNNFQLLVLITLTFIYK